MEQSAESFFKAALNNCIDSIAREIDLQEFYKYLCYSDAAGINWRTVEPNQALQTLLDRQDILWEDKFKMLTDGLQKTNQPNLHHLIHSVKVQQVEVPLTACVNSKIEEDGSPMIQERISRLELHDPKSLFTMPGSKPDSHCSEGFKCCQEDMQQKTDLRLLGTPVPFSELRSINEEQGQQLTEGSINHIPLVDRRIVDEKSKRTTRTQIFNSSIPNHTVCDIDLSPDGGCKIKYRVTETKHEKCCEHLCTGEEAGERQIVNEVNDVGRHDAENVIQNSLGGQLKKIRDGSIYADIEFPLNRFKAVHEMLKTNRLREVLTVAFITDSVKRQHRGQRLKLDIIDVCICLPRETLPEFGLDCKHLSYSNAQADHETEMSGADKTFTVTVHMQLRYEDKNETCCNHICVRTNKQNVMVPIANQVQKYNSSTISYGLSNSLLPKRQSLNNQIFTRMPPVFEYRRNDAWFQYAASFGVGSSKKDEFLSKQKSAVVHIKSYYEAVSKSQHPHGKEWFKAAYEGRSRQLQSLLRISPDIVECRNNRNETALIVTSSWGYMDCVKILLPTSDISAKDNNGATALWHAANWGHEHVVKLLICGGAAIDVQNREHQTSLFIASLRGNIKAVNELINCGANADISNEKGETALIVAVKNNNSDIAMKLIFASCNIYKWYVSNKDEMTALHYAALKGDRQIVKVLIETMGIDSNITAKWQGVTGYNLLHFASRYGHTELVHYLVTEASTDINAKNSQGKIPLDFAMDSHNRHIIQILVSSGSDKPGKQYNRRKFEKNGYDKRYNSPNRMDAANVPKSISRASIFSVGNASMNSDATIDQPYQMDDKPLGAAVIITNRTFLESSGLRHRTGTDRDKGRLIESFRNLGLEVFAYDDLSANTIIECLKHYSARDHSRFSCFVVCIMSHGSNNLVYGIDGISVPISEITSMFSSCYTPTLAGKPKMFIIVACQGKAITGQGKALVSYPEPLDPSNVGVLNEEDFLISFSTMPGYVSYRDAADGTPYIKALTQNLCKYSDQKCMTEILRNTEKHLTETKVYTPNGPFKQVCTVLSTLTRPFILRSANNNVTDTTHNMKRWKEPVPTECITFPDFLKKSHMVSAIYNGQKYQSQSTKLPSIYPNTTSSSFPVETDGKSLYSDPYIIAMNYS